MSLNAKVAVVTGATGALGRVVVKALLGQGEHIVSTYRSEEKQSELVDFVGEASGMLTSIQTDVTDEADVQALCQKVVEKYGHVDILLNIVGAFKGGTDIANTGFYDGHQPEICILMLEGCIATYGETKLR